ncbi:hypothetical protein GGR51DRAFT_366825 [Nemania sp. FL0031]|nr:hypothetical protein GGR51DRAFT_366825 [Nemania sp. FL0031]
MAPTPALPDTGLTSSNRETASPINQTMQRSRSWKKKLQHHVYSWKRQNSTGNASLGTSSVDQSSPNSTQSAHRLPGSNNGRHNAKSSPNQIPSIQSASLDSLTSASLFSRNSFPSMISNGTDATSVSDVFTSCGITCPVDSSSVKPYKRMKNNLMVYLAHDDIEIPLDVVEQWETTDLDRLKTDLSEVVMKIYRKGVVRESRRARSTLYPSSGPHEYDISFELRMSGRAMRDTPVVAIVPSIWLICGSTWACKEIRDAMKEITWPSLPVEIHEGRVPIPSVADGQVDISKLDLTNGYHLGDGITLYIHVEDLITETTSCGLLCCATIKDGDTYSHHFSRIGGLVTNTNTLTSSQFGVSTAHGMLDHPWWHRQFQERNSVPTWDCESIESTDSEDDYEFDSESESLYDDQESLYVEPLTDPFSLSDDVVGEGYRDPQLVQRWRNVSHHGVLSFLGASIQKESNLQHLMELHDDTVMQTDHAMIPLEWPQDTSFQPWKNKYFPSTLPDKPIDITTHMGNSKLTEGAVSIICQANSSINGHLMPGPACLAMGGRMFTLRKLKTVAPLARGISGSWVARGTELCGMILAVSNPEPYAYMMRAEDLISNLEASSPSIETVEIFSSHSRKVMHKASGALPRRWSSSRSHRRSVSATMSPRISIDDPRSITTIKRSLSTRISGLGGSSRRHDLTAKDVLRGKSMIPRRTRSVRGLLSDIFSTKLEEIAQPSDTKCADIKQAPEVRRPSPASYRPHSFHPVPVKRRPLTGKKLILKTPLEPISEVSSLVGLGIDSVPESNNVLLQSTLCSLTTRFRHGHIRLRKSDLIRVETLDVNAGLDLPECPEYNIALDKTVRLWHSGNYETQHEEEVDEIGDLVDWWDSWGTDVGGLITEQEYPPRPNSVMSDDFPGVSYSDTTSEDSYPSWPSRPASAAEGSFTQYSDEYELEDIKSNELSGGEDSGISLGVIGESGSDGSFKGTPREIYGGHCVPGIMA